MTSEESKPPKADEPGREGERTPVQRGGDPEDRHAQPVEDHDVSLDVPMLNIEEVDLEVEDLRAHISARAELVDFLNINIGVDVYLEKVKLQVKGVEAQLSLKVKLERILGTIDRALEVMAQNPQGLRAKVEDLSQPPEDLSRTPDAPEGSSQRGADEPEEVVEEAVPGDLSDLPIEEEYVDDSGKLVGLARDESGDLVEGTLDDEGNVMVGDDGLEATDAARRKAREAGIELSGVEGTGSGGRVLVKDVERAARAK